ncbi:MAG: ABC transporter ATP-binding protein [Ardenticatenaceae bacterium]|nr:ABC transporter ATP-binding protein [Ardenticatenaceae bacterium]
MSNAVELRNITKFFPSSNVLANNQVSLEVKEGEVHALVGENGAGKTTLMNILYGLHPPDSGQIFVDGQEVTIGHPDDAIRLGIGMVHQHFKLVPSFTIAENIMLGMEPNRYGLLQKREEAEMVRQLADKFGLPVDPYARVRDLPVGMQQRVEILKALEREAKILILDEPTAVLTPQEVKELLNVVRKLAERGRTIIFITHKLVEVKNVADRLSVMRGGRMIGTKEVANTSIPEMASMMVGRPVLLNLDKKPANPGQVVFAADDVTISDISGLPAVRHLSFQVRQGEVLGVAGVSGNGQTELVEAISGMRPVDGGSMQFLGDTITHASVYERRNRGMAHIPEDRIKIGLNLQTDLDENLIVSRYKWPEFNRLGFLIKQAMRRFAEISIKQFSIAAAQPGGGIATLSGGNMQKVVLARELAGNPKFVIANQPTRGLDVGSIEFVHRSLIKARDEGAGILLVSVELDEIMSLSDRVIVLYRGEIAGEVDPQTVTQEEIGLLMGGSKAVIGER